MLMTSKFQQVPLSLEIIRTHQNTGVIIYLFFKKFTHYFHFNLTLID